MGKLILSEIIFFLGTVMHAQSMINNLDGTLTGIAHLQSIKNELEYKRKDFIKMLETSAGIGSNSYKLLRKFNKVSD